MISKLILIMMTLSTFLVVSSASVLAFDPFPSSAVDCNDPKQANSSVCNRKSGDPIAGKDGLFLKLTNIMAYIGGIAAIIMIIVSGIRLMTSRGDSEKVKDARHTLTNVVIGLVVIILAKSLITYVVVRL